MNNTIKVALFSDLHIDWGYTAGKSNTCKQLLCCTEAAGEPQNSDQVAGKWGDVKCDLPSRTMDNMIGFIKDTIQPEFALWAGDSVSHDFAD